MRLRPVVLLLSLAAPVVGASACSGTPTDPPLSGPGPVASVLVTPSVPTLELPGHSVVLNANARDANGTNVPGQAFTWSSSDDAVATVDATGRVVATGIGSVTITAETGGFTGTATLQVTGFQSLTFINGSWSMTSDASEGAADAEFRGLTGQIFEEVRTRGGVEVLRVLTRIQDGTWYYGRADGERRRMQYFTGPVTVGTNTSIATSADGMNRAILENVGVDGFTIRLQVDDGGTWVDEATEVYVRPSPASDEAGGGAVGSSAAAAIDACEGHFRDFDFWVGGWNVTDQSGANTQGTSSITLVGSDCTVREHWTSGGGQGYSLNMYDAVRDDWTQVWMDDSNLELHIQGGIVDGAMVLLGQIGNQQQRITWTPLDGGRVRQHWEVSNNGTVWSTSFDGYYNPN